MFFLDNEIEICNITKKNCYNTLVFLKMPPFDINIVEDEFREQNCKNIVYFFSFKRYPVDTLKIQTTLKIILIFRDKCKDIYGY